MKTVIPEGVASALKIKHDKMIEWELVSEGGRIIAKERKAVNLNTQLMPYLYYNVKADISIYI